MAQEHGILIEPVGAGFWWTILDLQFKVEF